MVDSQRRFRIAVRIFVHLSPGYLRSGDLSPLFRDVLNVIALRKDDQNIVHLPPDYLTR